jgi:hypothetical protein
MQESLVRLSTHIPSFAKATTELAFFTGGTVGRDTTRRITEAAGAAAVQFQTAEVERIAREYPPAPQGPEKLVFHVDGAFIPLRHGEWSEVRTLAVGEVAPPIEIEGEVVARTHNLSYFSRLADSDTFGELALGELHRRGIETAEAVGAVVDGAIWCQKVIDLHYPEAVRILDFPHAGEYVSSIGHTVGADGPLLEAAAIAQVLHDLKHSGPAEVLTSLRDLMAAHPELPDLAKPLAYLEQREAQMQYPSFRAAGWPIGSGSVESANKLVVEERLKGAGMHWERQNVNPMLALRNAVCNDRWDEVWGEIEREQRRQVVVRRHQRGQQRSAVPAPTVPAGVAGRAAGQVRPGRTGGAAAPGAAAAGEERVPTGPGRPAPDHPWKRAWSARRQRELALSA